MNLEIEMKEVENKGLTSYWINFQTFKNLIKEINDYLNVVERECDIDVTEKALEDLRATIVCGEIGSSDHYQITVPELSIYNYREGEYEDFLIFNVNVLDVIERSVTLIDSIYKMIVKDKFFDYQKYKQEIEELKQIYEE